MRLAATALAVFILSAGVAIAADDFGAPFTNEAPSAFEDPAEGSAAQELSMDEAAALLNDIMPASGEDVAEDVSFEEKITEPPPALED